MKHVLAALALGALLSFVLTSNRTGPAPAGTAQAGGTPAQKSAGPQAQVEELRAEVKKLQELVPDQAAVMSHLGYHWSNLWFAVEQENWPLADFYLSETRANLKWAVRSRPFRKTAAGVIDLGAIAQALDNTQLTQMKEAVTKKEKERCVKLYDEAMQGCYACHKASEKPYLRPHRPVAPEARVINFDPKATEPQ